MALQSLSDARRRAPSPRATPAEIALYTGNDDNIIPDLFPISEADCSTAGAWTRRAVELLEAIHACRAEGGAGVGGILAGSAALTDANGALFDVRNGFAGCIAGLHEILRRQGLLAGRWCLDPKEDLSPGQLAEIDRVCAAYPQLADDEFVRANLDRWLK